MKATETPVAAMGNVYLDLAANCTADRALACNRHGFYSASTME